MAHNAYDRVGPFYLHYYRTQIGRGGGGDGSSGGPSVFYGSSRWRRHQVGDGFGSILRGLARFALPIIGRGIGAFASHTLDATDRGVSLGDAARSALKPTLQAVVSAGTDQFTKAGQKGNGTDSIKRLKMSTPSEFYERMQAAKRRKKHRQSGRGKSKKRQSGGGRKRKGSAKVGARHSHHQSGAGRKRRAGKKGAYKTRQSGSGRRSSGVCNF